MNSLAQNLRSNWKKLSARHPDYENQKLHDDFAMYQWEGTTLRDSSGILDDTNPQAFEPLSKPSHAVRTLIVLGFGTGSFLRHVVTSELAKEAQDLIIIEPSVDLFQYALSISEFGNIFDDKKSHWLIGKTPDEIALWFLNFFNRRDQIIQIEAVGFARHPRLGMRYNEIFDSIEKQFSIIKQILLELGSEREDALYGLSNTLLNQSWIESTPPVSNLRNSFNGKSALVISTGPSLTKSLEGLKKLKNEVLMISCDASLKILLNAGIQPHLVVTLERDEGAKPFFDNLKWLHPENPPHLISYSLVPPAVINKFSGPHWFAHRTYNYISFLDSKHKEHSLESGHSVAHLACAVSDLLGCSETFLIGQDLCLDPDSLASHAAGVAYEDWAQEQDPSQHPGLSWAEGNLRPRVPTTPIYQVFANEFFVLSKKLNTKLINITDGGLKIPGLEYRPFSRLAFENSPSIQASEILNSARRLSSSKVKLSPWNELATTLASFETKLQTLENRLHLTDTKEELPQVLFEARKQMVELLNNDHFFAFVAELTGKEFLRIENAWAQFSNYDQTKTDDKLKLAKAWVQSMNKTLQSILRLKTS